jgi:hypothetical protein
MNFKNRQNISDNEFNIVREILGYNSIEEDARTRTYRDPDAYNMIAPPSATPRSSLYPRDSSSGGIPTMRITPDPNTVRPAPSSSGGIPTIEPPPGPNKVRPAPSSNKSGRIVPIKKELSADELNAISLNVARGIDTDTGTAAANIKKRINALNTTEAKSDADDISVKENEDNATKSTVIENIRNKFLSGITTLSLLAASPGNASDNLSTIKNINPDKNLFQGAKNIKPKEKVMYNLIPDENAKKVKDAKSDKKLFQSEDFINEAEASATHTGKIKSSRRIMTVLRASAANDKEVLFQFDNGTSATIQPALAKMAIRYYQGLSEFEKAQAAKLMRSSFKDFLSATKR